MKSRRLAEADDYILELQARFSEMAAIIGPEDCGGLQDVMLDVVFFFKKTAASLPAKFGFLGRLPYRLAKCVSPGEAQVCLQQWHTVEPAKHDPLTRWVFEQTILLECIANLAGGQAGVAPPLQAVVDQLTRVPLTEMPVEGVHRRISGIMQHGHGTKFAHKCAAFRHEQNLADCKACIQTPGGTKVFLAEWAAYKSLVRQAPLPMGQCRALKIKDKPFRALVYRAGEHARTSWDAVANAVALPKGPPSDANEELVPAMRAEYLLAVLEERGIYSFPREGAEAGGRWGDWHVIFQVMEVESKNKKVVPTYDIKVRKKARLPMLIQPLAQFGDGAEDNLMVYYTAEAQRQDVMSLAPWLVLKRDLVRWQAAPCEVAGCLRLQSPAAAKPPMGLHDSACPTICLLYELRVRGWKPAKTPLTHRPADADKKYSALRPMRNKPYFQCLLNWGSIWECGQLSLPSTEPQDFYRLILRGKAVDPGHSSRHYKRALNPQAAGAEAQSDALVLAAQPDIPVPIDDIILEDHAGLLALPAPSAALPAPAPREGSSNAEAQASCSSSSSSTCSEDVGREQPDDVIVDDSGNGFDYAAVKSLDGASLLVEDRRAEPLLGRAGYLRCVLRCEHHANCFKKRNAGENQTKELGPRQPLAFLAIWHKRGASLATKAEHAAVTPSLREQRAWLTEHGFL